jgi:two-component system, chemotaxis family, CheB/CheR fusion protein
MKDETQGAAGAPDLTPGTPHIENHDDALQPETVEIPEEEVESRHLLPFLVVGIGASAGGTEAYISLFDQLDASTGMTFVVAPHLSPDHKSYLPDILSRHTQMPVITVESGMRPEPDHVYVLPAGSRLRIQHGAFHLEPTGYDAHSRPIDSFFRSLAVDQKNRTIGVVLSGMDSDGALGLRAIKGEGGITIVQSPETARFPDMPRNSISADHVDLILPPGAIATHLAELGRQFLNPALRRLEEGDSASRDDVNFGRILGLLRGVSGLDFRQYKPTTIRRRIARRMMLHRIETLSAYENFLRANSHELRDLQEDALISVTRFFRDSEVFDALKLTVLPPIFDGRAPDQQVRVWVAGCASGEEVYSIAMCMLEYVTGNPAEPPIQIFGTDASETNIQKARLGIYPESIAAEISPERLRRFFVKMEKGYQVAKRVRDLCIFARQNLCHDPPFSRIDLISCRNVLIYFGLDLQRQIIPTFHYALRPNGYLLLGSSETIREFTDLFALSDRKNKIFSKIGPSLARSFVDVAPRVYSADLIPELVSREPARDWSDVELQRAADRIVLARFGPPGVIVNDRLEIIQSRGNTTPYFEMPQGSASLHLTRMARENIAPFVSSAVRRAIESDIPVQLDSVRLSDGENPTEVTIEVLPIHTVQTRPKCFLVLFIPPRGAVGAFEPAQQLLPLPTAEEQEQTIGKMRHDLASTRLYLQSLLEERDAKNQELVSANEEIQSANEELQSTNEELETTKEELQSSNEELQTVNDELQNRNTVLTQASNDLSNLLNSVNLPVLMLTDGLTIRHFTPPAQRLMNVRASDVGRRFGELRMNLNVDNLEPVLLEVLETLTAREMEVQDRDGRWHLLRVRPYRTADNKIEGLVVALVDIDQLRRSQVELRSARDFARLVIESIPLPLVVIDVDFRIRTANDAFARLAGSTPAELETRFLPDLAVSLWGLEQPLRARLAGLRKPGEGDQFDFQHRTPGENPQVFSVRGCRLQPGDERFILVTVEDLTAHMEAERQLQEEGARLAVQVEAATRALGRSREDLRALARSLFTSQEDERRRVARELHDDVSQRLARLEMDADQLERQMGGDPAGAGERIRRFRDEIATLSTDVRAISHRLHPSIIEDLGLGPALRSLVDDFRDREQMIASYFEESVPQAVPLETATVVYRIAQEALRNVAKHAGKTHVKVTLRGGPGVLRLAVIDSGVGFDQEDARAGLGLISMEERARQVGATLDVESSLGEGTKVVVEAPLAVEA